MDLDAARSFLRDHHRAVLCTHRADGSPQLSPVVCALAGDGSVVVSTRETALKTHNLMRDPAVSLCVVSDAFFGEWIQIDGRAEVVHLPEAMEGLVDYYRSISGEHPDWDDYRRSMVEDRRVLLAISIERAGPDRQG
jgi:PPOX class probable F420-dependent enzyme